MNYPPQLIEKETKLMSSIAKNYKLTLRKSGDGFGNATIVQIPYVNGDGCDYVVSVSYTSTTEVGAKSTTVSTHTIETFDSFKKAERELQYQLSSNAHYWESTDVTLSLNEDIVDSQGDH